MRHNAVIAKGYPGRGEGELSWQPDMGRSIRNSPPMHPYRPSFKHL